MELIVELKDMSDILNTYNSHEVSLEFNEYLMRHLEFFNFKKSELSLNIKCHNELDKEKIKNVIHDYYNKRLERFRKIDDLESVIKFAFFFIGILAILISELFTSFLSELFLIFAWVIVWEIAYDLLFNEIREKRKEKIYKYLSNVKIIFTK